MKALCVCAGGRVRSMALRWVLTDIYAVDALACGVEKNSRETISTLCEWADHVFILDESLVEVMPEEHSSKFVVLDVGPDVWGTERSEELRGLVHGKMTQWIGENDCRSW